MEALIEQTLHYFTEIPIKYFELMDTSRLDESRYIVFITLQNHEKVVLKLYSNSYTNLNHIEECANLAKLYHSHGIVTPLFLKSKKGKYGEFITYQNKYYYAWLEQWIESQFQITLQEQQASFIYDLGKLHGNMHRISKSHRLISENRTPWGLFDTYLIPESDDENYTNANWLYSELLNTEVNQSLLSEIWEIYQQKRNKLECLYPLLPESMIQADLSPGNYIINEAGKIVGIYDYNCAGTDKLVSEFIQEAIFICFEVYDTEWFDNEHLIWMNSRFDTYLRGYVSEYHLSELELRAANLLYDIVRPFRWDKVKITLDKFKQGYIGEVNKRLEWMLKELNQDDSISKRIDIF